MKRKQGREYIRSYICRRKIVKESKVVKLTIYYKIL